MLLIELINNHKLPNWLNNLSFYNDSVFFMNGELSNTYN